MPSASQLESGAGFYRPHAVSWPRLIRAIVFGGAIAGTLDITDAFVTNALLAISPSPTRVLQSIASGLLGPAAYSGGAGTALLGLLCHFFIALSAAAVFVSVSQRLPVLQRRPVIAGIIFGLALHGVMQYVVLPLSFVRMSSTPTPPGQLVNQLLIHALGVGVPIALAARRWAPVNGTPSIP